MTAGAATAALPVVLPLRRRTAHTLAPAWAAVVMFLAISAPGWAAAWGTRPTALAGAGATVVTGILVGTMGRRAWWSAAPWMTVALVAWGAASVFWSRWPDTSVLTWILFAATTAQGIALASLLSWRRLLDAVSVAISAVLWLSLAFELWVALAVGGPLGTRFTPADAETARTDLWSTAQLFTSGRIEGFVGNANLLAMIALLAVVVLGIRLAVDASHRRTYAATLILAAFVLVRTGSATAFVATVAVAGAVLVTLTFRLAQTRTARTLLYTGYAVAGIGVLASVWVMRRSLLSFLGRESDFTDRTLIWQTVGERITASPIVGNGFATPWAPWDPAFTDWIVMPAGLQIIQAHSAWVDITLQLGLVGTVLLVGVYVTFFARAWRTAVGRGRWNLGTDRFTSVVSLLPLAVLTVLIVQGITESNPLLLWGWMLTVMLHAKLKSDESIATPG
ncbi:hypothetical protein GCM10009808_02740 [Microbacterium sediminicola]|uniref:O-antigen ligase-related domain-containing protein n=1 Tax=Microbacterium sediminicola TaxID=415210 RepID=A0ABN2HK90_9MICO